MKKVKILPVYPKFPLTFWGYKKALEYVGKSAVMTPTGMATVLAMLPENEFDIHRIIDLNVEQLTDNQIKNSDIGLVSSMKLQEDSQKEIVDRFHFYGKQVWAGGPFTTSYPERSNADYLICGEAEITFYPFIEDFLNKNAKKIYIEEEIIKNKRCKIKLFGNKKPILDETPIPRWDLLNLSKYHSPAVQFSRGCPHNCEFCDIKCLFGRIPRTKQPKQMIEEINALKKIGYRGPVMFVDDNILGNKEKFRELLKLLVPWQEKNNYPYSFFTEGSVDLAWDENKDILENMAKAGFDQVFVGIETIDNEVLEMTKKKQNIKIPPALAIKRIQNAGLEVTAGLIFGLDGEKPDVFNKTYNFIQETGIVVAMPGLLTALKGTDLYTRLEKEGRIRSESTGNNTHTFSLNFVPQLDEKFLIENYKEFLKKLYSPKSYAERCRVLQKNLSRNSRIPRRGLEGCLAFVKTIPNILFSESGLEYGKYLFHTLFNRPNYLPEAVTQFIKLDHFRTIAKEALKEDLEK